MATSVRFFLFVSLALLLAECKPRSEADLFDSASYTNKGGFFLRVTARMNQERFRKNPDHCFHPQYGLMPLAYVNPYNGNTENSILYSVCLEFHLQKVKKVGDREIVYASKPLRVHNLMDWASRLYCSRQYEAWQKRRGSNGDRPYLDAYNACKDLPANAHQIAAAAGYFFQIALENDNTVAGLEKFADVRRVLPLLREEDEMASNSFQVIQNKISDEFGFGHDQFKIPVLAMISGMVSLAMYDDTADHQGEKNIAIASAVQAVLYRKLALKSGFVDAVATPAEILKMPELCGRKMSFKSAPDACLFFNCTTAELSNTKTTNNAENSACKFSAFKKAIGIATFGAPMIALAFTIAPIAGKEDREQILNLTMKLVGKKDQFVVIPIEDFVTLSTLAQEFGFEEAFAD